MLVVEDRLIYGYACLHVLFFAWVVFLHWWIDTLLAISCIGSATPSSSDIATLPIFSAATLPVFSVGAPISSTMTSSLSTALPMHSSPHVLPHPGSVIASLPPKLVKKILDLDYIDMVELVPDSWRLQDDSDTSKCCHQSKRLRRGPVTDILLWIDCYATMVAVLVEKYPLKAAGFLSYMRTILKAQRSFLGDAWVSYDMAYRRRAANQKSLDWGVVDFTL